MEIFYLDLFIRGSGHNKCVHASYLYYESIGWFIVLEINIHIEFIIESMLYKCKNVLLLKRFCLFVYNYDFNLTNKYHSRIR